MTRLIGLLSALLICLSPVAFAAKEKAKSADAADTTGSAASTATRDWSKIDTDRDGYVEPAEMEKYLQSVWAQNGKATGEKQNENEGKQ
jgi:hypothetical protein